MNQYPLVSVAIPTYEGEAFLREALDSALSQSYPHIEIIISDDGSRDRTLNIAKHFQERSAVEFKIFTHERLGIARNWNFCIDRSRGEYIKFLFQDDLLEPTCIEAMVDLVGKDRDIGMVFSNRGVILEPEARTREKCLEIYRSAEHLHRGWSSLQSIQSGQTLLQDPNFIVPPLNKIGEPSTVLLKKEVFDTIGPFDPSLCQWIDVDMWMRIMTGYKIGFVDEVLSYFRVHPGQQTFKNIDSGDLVRDDDRFLAKLLTHPCYGSLPQSLKETIYSRKVVYVENDRDDARRQLDAAVKRMHQLEDEAGDLRRELQKTQRDYSALSADLFTARTTIEVMENSNFWKARRAWFKLKKLLNLSLPQ